MSDHAYATLYLCSWFDSPLFSADDEFIDTAIEILFGDL